MARDTNDKRTNKDNREPVYKRMTSRLDSIGTNGHSISMSIASSG